MTRKGAAMRIIAAFTALALSSAPVMADNVGLWSESDTWKVEGSSAGWCKATTLYPNSGHMISIAIGSESGWSLFVGGVAAIPGDLYEVDMAATNGASGTIVGRGISDNMVVFERITPRTIVNLAESRGLYIQGLAGGFSLKGSKQAIRDTLECYAAMTGELS